MDGTRRDVLTGGLMAAGLAAVGAAGAAPAAKATANDDASLRASFAQLSKTLNAGDVAGFMALFDERALVIDEDSPFRMTKAEFLEHLGFHGSGTWEGFAWVPRETRYLVRGDTGVTAGTVTFRGKPTDAGFRLRHMMHTIGWARSGAAGEWKIVCFHQTPLYGHLDGTSPGTGG